jgi:hypothetical protein
VVIGQRRRSIRRELPWEVHREIHVVCASCCPNCDDCVCVGGCVMGSKHLTHFHLSLTLHLSGTHSLSRTHAHARAYARALSGSSALTLVSYRGRRGTVIRLPSQPNRTHSSKSGWQKWAQHRMHTVLSQLKSKGCERGGVGSGQAHQHTHGRARTHAVILLARRKISFVRSLQLAHSTKKVECVLGVWSRQRKACETQAT